MATKEQMDQIFGSVGELRRELKSDAITQAIVDSVPISMAKYLTPERVQRILVAAASREPKLLKCTRASLVTAMVNAVQLGLEPGGPLGHAYLVPFLNRKADPERLEVTLIIGYQGYLALARRSGEIEDVYAQIIYSRDTYDIEAGDNPKIYHKPFIPDPLVEPPKPLGPGDIGRGVPVLGYCIARFKDGGGHKEWMTASDIEWVREQNSKSKSGPWFDHWEMMARKTVIRRARHYWPLSVEMASAFELDDRGSVALEDALGKARADEVVEASKTEALRAELKGEAPKAADSPSKPESEVEPAKAAGESVDPETGEVTTEPSPEEIAEAEAAAAEQAKKTQQEGLGF